MHEFITTEKFLLQKEKMWVYSVFLPPNFSDTISLLGAVVKLNGQEVTVVDVMSSCKSRNKCEFEKIGLLVRDEIKV